MATRKRVKQTGKPRGEDAIAYFERTTGPLTLARYLRAIRVGGPPRKMARSGERARACERRLRLLLASGPIAPVAMFKGNNVGGYLVIGGASYVVLQLGSRMPRLRVALP